MATCIGLVRNFPEKGFADLVAMHFYIGKAELWLRIELPVVLMLSVLLLITKRVTWLGSISAVLLVVTSYAAVLFLGLKISD